MNQETFVAEVSQINDIKVLKIMAYDEIMAHAQAQQNLSAINQRISQLTAAGTPPVVGAPGHMSIQYDNQSKHEPSV